MMKAILSKVKKMMVKFLSLMMRMMKLMTMINKAKFLKQFKY